MSSIVEIHRYPVKSMTGESLTETEVTEKGLLGDRAWAVRDEVRGGIRGAKKIAALMKLSARYTGKPTSGSAEAEISLPDGSTVLTSSADASARISAALNHEITLWPLVPADQLDHYRRGAPDAEDMMEELRTVFARTEDEPLPDLAVFPPELIEFESPPGTYFDALPILLVSRQSLATMQAASPESRFEVPRFRPNLVLDMPEGGAFPENELIGKEVQLGDCVLKIELSCPRCVMVTNEVEDLPKDPKVMRALVQQNGGDMGVYASVIQSGTIRTGDELRLM